MPASRMGSHQRSAKPSWSCYRSICTGVGTLVVLCLVSCKQAPRVPEPGALLLQLAAAPGVAAPDELRVSVYDDSGVLWNNVRFPAEGAVQAESEHRLGTILIQPGSSQGFIRIHVRGFNAGTRTLEGTLVVAPDARARGTFGLILDSPVPPDIDDDGVPDDIDDCLAIANPSQGGCPTEVPDGSDAGIPPDASPSTDVGDGSDGANALDGATASDGATATDGTTRTDAVNATDAAGDVRADAEAVSIDGPRTDGAAPSDGQSDACADGACRKSTGAACASETECLSTFCVDGVCCANACLGPCRSCNQPNRDGVCQAHPLGSNPEGECLAGATCNGAGACGLPPLGKKPNGQLCAVANECLSGFCADGVCCGSVCTAACQTCATGTCLPVTRKEDVPECVAPRTCNPAGKCG